MLFVPDHKLNIIKESDYGAEFAALEKELSEYTVSGEVASFDGTHLKYEYCLAESAAASVVIVHGFTEFMRKYHEAAGYFLNQGYNVFMYDQRGHGMSGRETPDLRLTHINNFDDYVKDLRFFIDNVVKPASDAPIFLFSHSMGGAVVLLYLQLYGNEIGKAVLSSPLICPRMHGLSRSALMKIVEHDARLYGWDAAFRHASYFNPDPSFEKSSDCSEARFLMNLNHRRSDIHYQNSASTNGWMRETLSLYDRIMKDKRTEEIPTEILLITAGKDRVVRIHPQTALLKKLPAAKQMYLENAKHTAFHAESDEENRRYWQAVFDFLSGTA